MTLYGDLIKMKVVHANPVQYTLNLNEDILMNELLGKKIKLQFTGTIRCVSCGKVTKKSFGQGFCYKCFMESPMNSECIIRPELCEAHLGKGRDPGWEEEHHNKPHIVYLALTSGVKVGVTREDQIPVRWIDQGARKAIQFARTPYRQIAGKIEVNLKQHMPDKTPWQKMLKNEIVENIDLTSEAKSVLKIINPEFEKYVIGDFLNIYEFNYPVLRYPDKIKSLSLDKISPIEGILTGIRGQYLMIDNSIVFNIRNHSGYEIELGF